MSAAQARRRLLLGDWRRGDGYRFGIINFANPDMVGHTGDIPAATRRIETVDACLAKVVATVHARGGACLITADHGNADHMLDPDGTPNTAHTTNPVPLIATVDGIELDTGGILADVSPTALEDPRDRAAGRGRKVDRDLRSGADLWTARGPQAVQRCAPTRTASSSRSTPARARPGPGC